MSDSVVILSRNVFPATGAAAFDGFVAVEGGIIKAVGGASEAGRYTAGAARVIDAGERTVMPGMTDVHTFFSGWVLEGLGCDLSGARDADEGIAALRAYDAEHPGECGLFGHAWDPAGFGEDAEDRLTAAFPTRPVVAFTADRGTCWMNAAARERYQFTPEACWSEMIWRMMPEYLAMPEVQARYRDYMRMLNARGVTAIKEMTFDDYYGFADVMERMEQAGEMSLRVSMMSQPVGYGANVEHGIRMRDRFTGPFVSFSGYNRMTDRGVAGGLAEYIDPYASDPSMRVAVPVEWELIESELAAIDAAGFRYSLHCQGDGAVRHTVDAYDRLCAKDASGRLANRHAITDLECTNPADLERFGALGGIVEVYPQIQSLDAAEDIRSMALRQIGPERFARFWNRRKMWDSGIVVSCGTDLPLLTPHIGESIFCGCGGCFDDGVALNRENMLSIPEMLTAWTANGAYNCYAEDRLGTLEEGKLADIVVLDRNVLDIDPTQARGTGVALTMSDGRIVYENL